VVELNGLNWDEKDDWFFKNLPPEHRIDRPVRRRYRGYWTDRLLGGPFSSGGKGLLHTFCVKMPNGKWVLTEDLNKVSLKPANNETKTYLYNKQRRDALYVQRMLAEGKASLRWK